MTGHRARIDAHEACRRWIEAQADRAYAESQALRARKHGRRVRRANWISAVLLALFVMGLIWEARR